VTDPTSKSILLSLRNAYEALAVSAPTVIEAARGRLSPKQCDERLETFAAHVMRNAQVAVTVHGREVLEAAREREAGGAFVVMSNHQSHYDIPVLYHVLGGNMRMVAKKELFSLPLFGRAIRDAGMIEVDRANRQRAIESLANARKQLEGGTNIWIAPEGTRSETGELLPFKKGGFVLAIETEAPILPVTVVGTRDVLPVHAMRSRRGAEVYVTIHPPVDTRKLLAEDREHARERSGLARALIERLMDDVRRAIGSAL